MATRSTRSPAESRSQTSPVRTPARERVPPNRASCGGHGRSWRRPRTSSTRWSSPEEPPVYRCISLRAKGPVERFPAAREMASKRFRFYFILARTPLDATIIVSVRFTTGNRVVATRTAVKRSLRDQRANQRRCTSEPPERFHFRDRRLGIGSRFRDHGCIGNPALAVKARRSTRKACRDLDRRGWIRRCVAHAAGCCYSRAAAPFRYIIPPPFELHKASSMAASHKAMKTVGIAGAGLMGRGIAQIVAQAGFDVCLLDAKPFAAADAKRLIAEQLATLVAKGKLSAAAAESAVAHIALPESIAGFADADLVIEAIVERLEAKQTLIASLDGVVGKECILATNTSSLSVTAIAAASAHPARVAGLHFFSPVPLMKLVEVIDGLLTSPVVMERLVEFASALGHTPVKAKDTPGFIVNHAGRGYGTEALRIIGEGVADAATIDLILKLEAGFRMGPFELLDLTGLDVSHPVMESIYHQSYEEPRFRPSPLTAQRLAAGLLGRKSGRGFYDYRGADALARPSIVRPTTITQSNPAPTRRGWVSGTSPGTRQRVVSLLQSLGAEIDAGATPESDSLCIVLPSGRDATTAALDERLDPRRTVALDTLFDMSRHRTLMTTSVTEPYWRDAAKSMFAADGVPVHVIHDSPGFVVQRTVAHVVNIACDIAQQRIATPEDIDLAVRIGLAYPAGPLAWGDAIGPPRLLRILKELARTYGDPRYRPSLWLSRRARLGVSLLTPES